MTNNDNLNNQDNTAQDTQDNQTSQGSQTTQENQLKRYLYDSGYDEEKACFVDLTDEQFELLMDTINHSYMDAMLTPVDKVDTYTFDTLISDVWLMGVEDVNSMAKTIEHQQNSTSVQDSQPENNSSRLF